MRTCLLFAGLFCLFAQSALSAELLVEHVVSKLKPEQSGFFAGGHKEFMERLRYLVFFQGDHQATNHICGIAYPFTDPQDAEGRKDGRVAAVFFWEEKNAFMTLPDTGGNPAVSEDAVAQGKWKNIDDLLIREDMVSDCGNEREVLKTCWGGLGADFKEDAELTREDCEKNGEKYVIGPFEPKRAWVKEKERVNALSAELIVGNVAQKLKPEHSGRFTGSNTNFRMQLRYMVFFYGNPNIANHVCGIVYKTHDNKYSSLFFWKEEKMFVTNPYFNVPIGTESLIWRWHDIDSQPTRADIARCKAVGYSLGTCLGAYDFREDVDFTWKDCEKNGTKYLIKPFKPKPGWVK